MSESIDMLHTYLATRDIECPACAYNLRGLKATRCPECNQELVLRVGLAEPRMAWFVAGVIGISMGLGFSSMVLAWATVLLLTRGGGGLPQLREMLPLMVGTLVGAALMWWWVRARRRCAAASNSTRWCRALAASTVSLASPL